MWPFDLISQGFYFSHFWISFWIFHMMQRDKQALALTLVGVLTSCALVLCDIFLVRSMWSDPPFSSCLLSGFCRALSLSETEGVSPLVGEGKPQYPLHLCKALTCLYYCCSLICLYRWYVGDRDRVTVACLMSSLLCYFWLCYCHAMLCYIHAMP